MSGSHFGLASAAAAAAILGAIAPLAAKEIRVAHCVVSLVDEAQVAAREVGILDSVAVREGDAVTVGQLLARIDDAEARMQHRIALMELEAAEARASSDIEVRYSQAAAKVAEAEYLEAMETNRRVAGTITATEVRRRELTWNRSVLQIEQSQLDFRVSQLAARARAAQVEAAELAVARRQVVSPIDGLVERVHRHPGEWIGPGEVVARVIRMDRLRVEGYLSADAYQPQDVLGRPAVVEVQLTANRTLPLQTRISFASMLVEASGEFRIAAEIENVQQDQQWMVRPGLTATMRIDVAE